MRQNHRLQFLYLSTVFILLQIFIIPTNARMFSDYQADFDARIEEKRIIFDSFTFQASYSVEITYDAILSIILSDYSNGTYKLSPFVLLNTQGDQFLDQSVFLYYNLTTRFSDTKVDSSGVWYDEFTIASNPVNTMDMAPIAIPRNTDPLEITLHLSYRLKDAGNHFDKEGTFIETIKFTGINQDVTFLITVGVTVVFLYILTISLVIRKSHGRPQIRKRRFT